MKRLCDAEPQPDALRDSGKPRRECRAERAVEDPDLAKRLPAQQDGQLEHVHGALELRAVVFEIDGLGNAGVGGEELLGAARRRGEEGDLPAGRHGGDGMDEGQVPDDVADAAFHLNDRDFIDRAG